MLPNEWKKDYLKGVVAFACANTIYYKNEPIIKITSGHKCSFGYIYITILRCTGHVYIGQHRSDSYAQTYIGSGNQLRNARKKKYTREDFFNQPLEFADSQEHLNLLEIEYITMGKDIFGDKCVNIV